MDPQLRKTIVWIEDDSPIIAPVVLPLERAGHHVERMRTAGEALDNLEALRTCDLILLDIFVPVGGAQGDFGRYVGLHLLRELRQTHAVKTPVVVLSVLTNSRVHEELTKLDVHAILRKPILPSLLKKTVEDALGLDRHSPSEPPSQATGGDADSVEA